MSARVWLLLAVLLAQGCIGEVSYDPGTDPAAGDGSADEETDEVPQGDPDEGDPGDESPGDSDEGDPDEGDPGDDDIPVEWPVGTRIACVGDSITEGAGLASNATESYPAQLQALLGEDYVVVNFGRGGTTMLKSGDQPYWEASQFAASTAFEPDIVLLMLGTNDSKTNNWWAEESFEADYIDMVTHYRDAGAIVYIMLSPPAYYDVDFWHVADVVPHIENVIVTLDAPSVDVHSALSGTPELFIDAVHPNAAGYTVLAQTVRDALLSPP